MSWNLYHTRAEKYAAVAEGIKRQGLEGVEEDLEWIAQSNPDFKIMKKGCDRGPQSSASLLVGAAEVIEISPKAICSIRSARLMPRDVATCRNFSQAVSVTRTVLIFRCSPDLRMYSPVAGSRNLWTSTIAMYIRGYSNYIKAEYCWCRHANNTMYIRGYFQRNEEVSCRLTHHVYTW